MGLHVLGVRRNSRWMVVLVCLRVFVLLGDTDFESMGWVLQRGLRWMVVRVCCS
jgi:hypothetical protein